MATGLEPGDRVGVWAPNIAEWVIAALGALGAGGVLVPLDTRFKGAEAAFVLGRSGARFLCTVNGFLGNDYVAMLREAGPRPEALEHVVVLKGDAPGGTVSFADFLARAGDVTPEAAHARADAVAPDDVADIIFTSGTTGKPKGAMTTHAQTLRTFDAWANTVGLVRGRPLPRGEPVLPHVRVQGRHRRLLHQGRDHRARAGVRRAAGARPRRRASASRCCPDHRPCTSRSSTIPTATGSTSRRCGSR